MSGWLGALLLLVCMSVNNINPEIFKAGSREAVLANENVIQSDFKQGLHEPWNIFSGDAVDGNSSNYEVAIKLLWQPPPTNPAIVIIISQVMEFCCARNQWVREPFSIVFSSGFPKEIHSLGKRLFVPEQLHMGFEAFGNTASDIFVGNLNSQIYSLREMLVVRNSPFDYDPWALRLDSNSIGLDHRPRSFGGFPNSVLGSVEGLGNVIDTSASNPERDQRGEAHNPRPAGHGLLGLKVLLGICGLIAGAYLVIDAFEQGSRLKPRTGAFRVVLGAYLMLMGGLLATYGI